MKKESEDLKKEVESLKKRVAELESKPRIEYHYHYSGCGHAHYWPNYTQPTWPYSYIYCNRDSSGQYTITGASNTPTNTWTISQ